MKTHMLKNMKGRINEFTFNRVNSLDMGLMITAYEQTKPEQKLTTEYIPGKGNVIIDTRENEQDTIEYEDIEKRYTCILILDDLPNETIDTMESKIAAWLLQTTEYKRLTDTYEPIHYRKAYCSNIEKNVIGTGQQAAELTITMLCKAFKYSLAGEAMLYLSKTTKQNNPENYTAYPTLDITLYADGVVYFGNQQFGIGNITGDTRIIVDCEEKTATIDGENAMDKILTYDFPYIPKGEITTTWTGGVIDIMMKGNWRKL